MRNYKLDMYKGIAVLAVLWLHTGSFVSATDSEIFNYIRSLASMTVPFFYVLSGYFIAKSNNVESKTISLLIKYLFMCTLTIPFVLYYDMLEPSEIIPALYQLVGSGIGYLWFVRGLLIYRFVYIIIKRLSNSNVFAVFNMCLIIIMLIFSSLLPISIFTLCLYAPIGYLCGYYNLDKTIKLDNKYLIVIPLLFLLSPNLYNPYRPIVLVSTLLIFMSCFDSKMAKNKLAFFSRNSLNFLFIHFFVLNIMRNNNLFYIQSFLISFFELLLVSSCLILIYEKIKQKSQLQA